MMMSQTGSRFTSIPKPESILFFCVCAGFLCDQESSSNFLSPKIIRTVCRTFDVKDPKVSGSLSPVDVSFLNMVLLLKKVIIIKSNSFVSSIKLLTLPECSQACRLEVPGQHVFILEHGVVLFKRGHVGAIDRQQGRHRNRGGKS